MRKRKDAVALFELIGKEKLQRTDAGEATPSPETAPVPVATVAPPPTRAPVQMAVPADPPPARPAAVAFGEAPGRLEPLKAAMGRPLDLPLTVGWAVAGAAVVVVLLVLSFVLGRVTAGADDAVVVDEATAELEQADQAAPKQATAATPATPAATAKRVSGKWYLVIQETSFSKQPARDAQVVADWLNSKGEPAQAVRTPDGKFYVMSTTAFDSSSGAEAQTFARSIEVLGKQYQSEGGQYDFRSPWFNQERAARE